MQDNKTISVRVTRRFDFPAERVFDAWLDGDMIGRWMFGPALRDEEILRIALDARIGGSFSFLVRRHGQEIDHIGNYLEIDRPRRIVFTWGIAGQSDGDDSRVIVEIAPQDGGCELVLIHEMDAKWAEYADRTRNGWTKMVDALAEVLG